MDSVRRNVQCTNTILKSDRKIRTLITFVPIIDSWMPIINNVSGEFLLQMTN